MITEKRRVVSKTTCKRRCQMDTGFFRKGMGTQFGNEWRYKRQEMGRFINAYEAISIPAFDYNRIVSHQGVEYLVIEEMVTGFDYCMPIDFLPSGTFRRIEGWQEPQQYFLRIEWFDRREHEQEQKPVKKVRKARQKKEAPSPAPRCVPTQTRMF
jgi:hypothetical protein